MGELAAVRARRFGYRYPGATSAALEDIDLLLEPASFTAVAGVSGSGKSTLLRALCGLVPHFHGGTATGELDVCGLALRDSGPAVLAAVCGTVFQDPETQVVMNGVRAEIALGLEQRGAAPAAVARAVEEAALVLGIADLLERPVESLSGGELQRVAIAAAIAHRPPLLVLDEPTSQLDPVAGDELIWLLRRLNEESGTAVVIAEHRLERCVAAADRVVALEGGRVAFDGAPDGFLSWATAEREVLATPAARLFSLAGLSPLPSSVKQARAALRGADLIPAAAVQDPPPRSRRRGRPALRTRGLWYEVPDGPAVLRGVDLRLDPGERVALMGRNGAGKSTLLRVLKGLVAPTRGRVELAGPVALLMQNPGDYLVHEHVREELPVDSLAPAGLADRPDAHPRDLSGGERQRLALEIVLGTERPALVCLDEPTRGMDRAHKGRLGERLDALAADGSAVIVATHDAEFVAGFATRVLLMGKGVTIADGPTRELLEGGWYFATEVARIVDGALTPEDGATLLRRELVA